MTSFRYPVLVLTLTLLAGALIALPAVSRPAPTPEPVAVDVDQIAIDGVHEDALGDTQDPHAGEKKGGSAHADEIEPALVTDEIETDEFGVVGVQFEEPLPEDSVVQVRTREGDGWTDWYELPTESHIPDPQDPDYDSVRSATEPLLTTGADGVQVRVDTPDGEAPVGAEIATLPVEEVDADRGVVKAGEPQGQATAASAMPRIISRSEWGADESLRNGCPGNTDAHKVVFLHHTAGNSNYGPTGGPAEMRSIYSYTVNVRGYCDFPYNYGVDKYGNIYEGRGGGIDQPVKSGGQLSFNEGSMAIGTLGNFESGSSTGWDAINRAVGQLAAWKLSLTGRSATGSEALYATSGSAGPAKGSAVTFQRISGHRDANDTSCPGSALYAQLPRIREIAAGFQSGQVTEEPTGRTPSSITQWSQTHRTGLAGHWYSSSFRVSPGGKREVAIQQRKNGKLTHYRTVTTDSSGYAKFAVRYEVGAVQYRLRVKRTESAANASNSWMTLEGLAERIDVQVPNWPSRQYRSKRAGSYVYATFKVTPARVHTYIIKRRREGQTTIWGKGKSESNGRIRLRVKAYPGKAKYKVVVPRTSLYSHDASNWQQIRGR
ncbi:MAG: N-acetylmuramoyl-L-alanine amidase [Actinobacteria bacterium]|nr:N-acetylmuramoyl-L-alanine amidase [Actinomycetota bacterium]